MNYSGSKSTNKTTFYFEETFTVKQQKTALLFCP